MTQACTNSVRIFWNGTKGWGPLPFGWWSWELAHLGVSVTMFQPQAEHWAVIEAQWGWTPSRESTWSKDGLYLKTSFPSFWKPRYLPTFLQFTLVDFFAYIPLSIDSLWIHTSLIEMEFRIGLTPADQECDLFEKSSAPHGEMSAGSLLLCSALRFIKCFLTCYLILSL